MITIALYNLKGGVGKTTTAVNMAYLASQAKRNTVLWDCDPQAAASWFFGVDTNSKKAIRLFNKGTPIGSLEVQTPYERLTVIPADLSLRNVDLELDGKSKARKFIRNIVEPLSENTSVLVFDCPPTLSPSVEYLLAGVDLVLVPIIPSPMSIRAAQQVVEFFEGKKHAPDNIVGFFNMVDMRRNIHKEALSNIKKLPFPMLKTFVPMDSAAEAMSYQRKPLVNYANSGRAAHAYRRMWKEVIRLINKERKKK